MLRNYCHWCAVMEFLCHDRLLQHAFIMEKISFLYPIFSKFDLNMERKTYMYWIKPLNLCSVYGTGVLNFTVASFSVANWQNLAYSVVEKCQCKCVGDHIPCRCQWVQTSWMCWYTTTFFLWYWEWIVFIHSFLLLVGIWSWPHFLRKIVKLCALLRKRGTVVNVKISKKVPNNAKMLFGIGFKMF